MTTTSQPKPDYKVVGTRPVRHDGVDKVTGRALYGADMHLVGLLHGKVLRSPHAHARIKSIDTSKAEAHPDVKAVITAKDLAKADPVPQEARQGVPVIENILARSKVLYKGHAIAAVAAVNVHVAEEALALIEVEYEVLPSVSSAEEALAADAPVLHEHWVSRGGDGNIPASRNIAEHEQHIFGDLEAGFAAADLVLEREYRTKTVHQGYIEPHTATAWWAPNDDRLTIWSSSQGHFAVRDSTARILGIPNSKVKVVPMEIGGGFGGKTLVYVEPLAAALSKKTGKPVKVTMTRAEVLESSGPTAGSYMKCKMGVTNDGKITAAKIVFAFEGGAYPGAPLPGACAAVFAPYAIENVQIDGYDITTNKPKTAAYRAPGAPIVCFASETLVDEIAEKLNMDPIDFRLLNVATEGTRRADGVMNGRIGAREVMEAVKNHPHYKSKLEGPNRGRGFAMGFCRNNAGMSSTIANVLSNGSVSLIEGSMDIGGSRTAVAQMFAEALGIPITDVFPIVGDTDSVGFTSTSGGSGVAFKTGWAAFEAANDVKRQFIQRAAMVWETDQSNVEYVEGGLRHKLDTELKMTFKEAAAMMPQTGGPVVGRANLNPAGSLGSYAANVVDLEVDPDTGKVSILRYSTFQDVGTAVHPSYVEGQLQGGAVQGIGWALNEEYYIGNSGQLMNNSLLDYRMPTALDLPLIDAVLIEVPNPRHPFGVKGVGEANIVPPLATVANGIHDAIGVRMYNLPMNPQAVLEAIQSKV
jgi:CO/xanthine dehydrogenase Mo-binding subunit